MALSSGLYHESSALPHRPPYKCHPSSHPAALRIRIIDV
jgi:hypothetical protein